MTLQTDPGWLPSRIGCLSASRFKDAINFKADGKESEARQKYRSELVAERIAGYAADHPVTEAMKRGLAHEDGARRVFEEETGKLIGPARLFAHPTIEFLVATPDATLGADSLVEFKVPLMHNFLLWVEKGVIPKDHIPQLALQQIVTGRTRTIFCAYCPELPAGRRLFMREFAMTDEERADYTAKAVQFLEEVEHVFRQVTATEVA